MVVVSSLLWIISFTLLILASTSPERFAEGKLTWEGAVDVGAALALVILSFLIYRDGAKRIDLKTLTVSYAIASLLPALIFLLMWMFRVKLVWNTLLPGLAWRSWLLLYTLPAAIAVW
jgi:hypothetical protein